MDQGQANLILPDYTIFITAQLSSLLYLFIPQQETDTQEEAGQKDLCGTH